MIIKSIYILYVYFSFNYFTLYIITKSHLFCLIVDLMQIYKTLYGGSLGSWIDEERS